MSVKLKHLFENFIPFLILGIVIALAIGFLIMFSYVLLWGLAIGLVFWAISFVKNLFHSKPQNVPSTETKGRVIEHDDKN